MRSPMLPDTSSAMTRSRCRNCVAGDAGGSGGAAGGAGGVGAGGQGGHGTVGGQPGGSGAAMITTGVRLVLGK